MSGWKKSPLDMLTCNRRVVCSLLSGRERVRINGSWKLLIKPYRIWFNNKLKGVTDILESYELISFENYSFCQLCYWRKKKKKERKKHQAWPSWINTLRWWYFSFLFTVCECCVSFLTHIQFTCLLHECLRLWNNLKGNKWKSGTFLGCYQVVVTHLYKHEKMTNKYGRYTTSCDCSAQNTAVKRQKNKTNSNLNETNTASPSW